MNSSILLYDWSGAPVSSSAAPVTSRPGQALTSPQGGIAALGSDYGSAPAAQIPKVDASGQQYMVPVVAGTPVPWQVNAVTSNPNSAYGSIALGWDNANSRFTPYLVDPTGATVTRNSLANTCSFAPSATISTTGSAGKSMMSIYNGSTNLYFRCSALFLMCPPQAAVSGGLLQTSTTYTTVGMQVARVSSAPTGGTVIGAAYHDTRTPTDATIVCRTGATVTNQESTPLRVMDAAYSSTYPYLTRSDPGMQLPCFGPGQGMNVQVLSAVGGSGVSFYVTAIIAQNTA